MYIGKGKKPRIALSVLELPREQGGLKLVNLFKRQMSLKAQWIVMIRDNPQWAAIAHSCLIPDIGNDVWRCNINADDIDMVIPQGSFWKQVLYAWCLYNFSAPVNARQVRGQIIWNNSLIKVARKVLYNKKAWEMGLIYVNNLTNDNGLFSSYDELTA